jgi:hypothetical protein
MINLDTISEDEKALLAEIAAAKGQTLEEALVELGHAAPAADATVVLGGEETPQPNIELPVVLGTPVNDDKSVLFVPQLPEVEPPPPPAAAEEAEADEPANDRPSTLKHICVNCGHDQELPVVAEPERQDKIGFLSCVLGQKLFSKKYLVFGGHLRLKFRTLTIREIDILYEETYKAKQKGMILTTQDYYENINRLRLYLQLVGVSSQQTATHIILPEGFTAKTNPEAATHWDTFLKEKNVWQDDKDLMLQVEEYVMLQVIKTESLHRAVTHTCAKFNKLVARLECCVDDQSFWEGIGPQF